MKNKKLKRQLLFFLIIGFCAFIIDYSFLIIFKELCHLNVYISSILSFCISVIFNYYFSLKYVFITEKSKKNFIIFILSSIIGVLLTELCMFIGVDVIKISYLIVKIISTAIVMVFNFVTRKLIFEKGVKFNIKLNNLVYISLILLMVFAFTSNNFQNDLFFDIKTGESILKYGIDFKDHFSFIPDLIYLYHHWFYDLIIYFIYNKFSYVGVYFSVVTIFSIFSILFFKQCEKYSNRSFLSFIVTLTFIFFSSAFFSSRVQTITYLLFLFEIILLNKIYKTSDKKLIALLLINSVLILNMHMPLWFFTIVLFMPYLVETVLCLISDKNKKFKSFITKYIKLEKPDSYKTIFITLVLLLLTGLLSPHKLMPYVFFIKVFTSTGFKTIDIIELQKTVLIESYDLLFLLIMFIALLFVKKLKITLRDFLMFIGLFIFTLMAGRNEIYFLIFAPLILLKSYDYKDKKECKFLNKITSKINIKVLQVVSILFVIATYIGGIIYMDFKNYSFYINDDYPVKIVEYLKENTDYKNIKLFNEFNYGSYIEFNDIPVFIDSRAEVYIKDFNGGKDIVSDYVNAEKYFTYKEVFNKYKFDYAITSKDRNLYKIFTEDKDFELILEDNYYVLFKCK